ncbi:DNA-deoxyinosine glycosylase [Paraburkholderia sp.]|uniref:DNA-deoxyinosine glycosylase n=1 Tax=Paraburkholderia sp. TaxID=1926495 RepID=UPI0025D89E00|nr:DNA-deoxyinosine glycosylase [Paraburkholderia sp.]
MTFKRCFAPVVDEMTRVLILGSLPGEVSLAHGQYYANPQNKFFNLVGDTIGVPLIELDYAARLRALLDHHIGLWDVVAEARRIGSLDSRIRDHASNDLIALIDTLPNLVAIAFNGGTAEKIGMRALGETADRYRLIRLPSSSPAYASLSYDAKLCTWEVLRQWLPM